MPPDPLNGLEITVELNLGLEKSGNFILSGKWQPCPSFCILYAFSDLIRVTSSAENIDLARRRKLGPK